VRLFVERGGSVPAGSPVASTSGASVSPVIRASRRGAGARNQTTLAGVALVVGGVVAGSAAWVLKPEPPPEPRPVIRSVHLLPEGQAVPVARPGVAISPDGRRFAYMALNGGIHLRAMDTLDAAIITGMEGQPGNHVVFSPDGQSVVYWARDQLRRIAVTGGGSVALADLPGQAPFGISRSTDDTILYAANGSIWRVSENGGEPERLITTQGEHPQRLPYGDWILYARQTGDSIGSVEAVSPSSGEQRTLLTGATDVRYLPTGHLVYAFRGVLYAVPFDAERLAITGRAVPVIEGVRLTATGLAHFDVSDTGTLVYMPGPARQGEEFALAVADRSGQVTRIDNGSIGPYVTVRASLDGKQLAIDSDDGNEASIWIYDLGSTSAMRRLTFTGRNGFPVWSPDGERVAFQSDRDGNASIYVQRVDGTGGAQRLTTAGDGEAHIPESWSPNGQHLSFSVVKGSAFALWMLSLEDGTAAPFGNVQSIEPIGSVFSPDGKWIAYHSLPAEASALTTVSGVFVEPFPATGARYQAPKVLRDFHPVWSPEGTELNYLGSAVSGQLATVQVATVSGVTFGPPASLPFVMTAGRLSGVPRAFDVLPDGRFVGLVAGSAATEADTAPQIRIVVNWFEELKRLVPTH
jgi:Tol biopolymer transport system component